MRRPSRLLIAGVVAGVAWGCGKRGNPLPPLRPVPTRVVDATAVRSGNEVTFRFTVPSANLDGSTPVVIDRVDVFAWRGAQGATPPPAGVIAGDRDNLRTSLAVTRPPAEGSAAAAPSGVGPGGAAVVVDRLDAFGPEVAFLAYVVVPVAGTGRGRAGPPSPPLVVPLVALPGPPGGVTLTPSETEVRIAWTPPSAGLAFRVLRTTAGGQDAGGPPLISSPVTAPELAVPVTFGAELCVVVEPVLVIGNVSLQGSRSSPACVTPVDRYAPPAPEGLRVVQEGNAVGLSWTAVTAADLAGYIVLRGTGAGNDLQPLVRTPIRETTYRDTTVQAGTTYVYAVYAQDTAATPNVSQLSARQTIAVR